MGLSTISASGTGMQYKDPTTGLQKSLDRIGQNVERKRVIEQDRAGAEALRYASMDYKQKEAFLNKRKQVEIDNAVKANAGTAKDWYNPADWFRNEKEAYVAENTNHSPDNGVAIAGTGDDAYNQLVENVVNKYSSQYNGDIATVGPKLDATTGNYTNGSMSGEATRLESNYLSTLGLTADQQRQYTNTVRTSSNDNRQGLLFSQGQQDRVTKINDKELKKSQGIAEAKALANQLGIKYDDSMINGDVVMRQYNAHKDANSVKGVKEFASKMGVEYKPGLTNAQITALVTERNRKSNLTKEQQEKNSINDIANKILTMGTEYTPTNLSDEQVAVNDKIEETKQKELERISKGYLDSYLKKEATISRNIGLVLNSPRIPGKEHVLAPKYSIVEPTEPKPITTNEINKVISKYDTKKYTKDSIKKVKYTPSEIVNNKIAIIKTAKDVDASTRLKMIEKLKSDYTSKKEKARKAKIKAKLDRTKVVGKDSKVVDILSGKVVVKGSKKPTNNKAEAALAKTIGNIEDQYTSFINDKDDTIDKVNDWKKKYSVEDINEALIAATDGHDVDLALAEKLLKGK